MRDLTVESAGNERTLYPAVECRQEIPDQDRNVEACGDINLDIRQSEFVAVVGPSGCGKTTILKMVAGLQPYTSGTITVAGKRVDRPQTDVGIVFQEAIMLDWRDVLANVMLQVDIRKLERAKYEPIAREPAEGNRARRVRDQEALRIVRRHAPAGVDLPRAGARPEHADDGRAVRRARRADARADLDGYSAAVDGNPQDRACISPTASRKRCCSPTGWW